MRRWQQACETDDSNEGAGSRPGIAVDPAETTAELEPLERPRRQSTTDPDARFLRSRGGRFLLGYSAEIAVSACPERSRRDHLIVAQRVTQAGHENHSLEPMVTLIAATCGSPPRRLVATPATTPTTTSPPWKRVTSMPGCRTPTWPANSTSVIATRAQDRRCRDPRLVRMCEKMRSPDLPQTQGHR